MKSESKPCVFIVFLYLMWAGGSAWANTLWTGKPASPKNEIPIHGTLFTRLQEEAGIGIGYIIIRFGTVDIKNSRTLPNQVAHNPPGGGSSGHVNPQWQRNEGHCSSQIGYQPNA